MSLHKSRSTILVAVLAGCLVSGIGWAQPSKRDAEAIRRAAEVLVRARERENFCLSQELAKAQAIAIFPKIKNIAFAANGKWGDGLFVKKVEGSAFGDWSSHSFLTVGGGGVGFEIGWQTLSALVIFETADAVTKLVNGGMKLTFGANASATAGTAGVNTSKLAAFAPGVGLYIIKSNGLFGGAKFESLWMSVDQERDDGYYGTSSQRALAPRLDPADPAAALHAELMSTKPQGGAGGGPKDCSPPQDSTG